MKVMGDGPLTVLHDAIGKQYIVRCFECRTADFFDSRADAEDNFQNHNHQEPEEPWPTTT
jgi:hypothetical protein